MLFLGTGAAELVPNPFCDCPLCQRIRAGKELPRKRSAFLLDNQTCIDFGPDVMAASQQYQAPLYDLTDIIITHTHADHLCFDNLEVLTMTPRGERQIRLWLSPPAVQWVYEYLDAIRPLYNGCGEMDKLLENGCLKICQLEPYQWNSLENVRVYPVVANHRGNHPLEWAFNPVIEKNGQRILYAVDTGLYSRENLQALQGFDCQTVIMEGTYGSWEIDKSAGHLSCYSYLENAEKLIACGAASENTKFYVTHINQCHSFDHQEYQAFMNENSSLDITVAWDGLHIETK